MNCTEPDAQENCIVLLFKLDELDRIDRCLKVKIDSQLRKHLDLTQAFAKGKLVFCDPIRVQASRQRTCVVEIGANTAAAELCSAGERGWTSADQRNREPDLGSMFKRQRSPTFVERVHGEPLQPRDLNRLLVVAMHYAGALTEHLDRACPSAACAQNIRIEDRVRRADEIAAGYLLDETRYINMSRTSCSAWRIEAKETPVCLRHG